LVGATGRVWQISSSASNTRRRYPIHRLQQTSQQLTQRPCAGSHHVRLGAALDRLYDRSTPALDLPPLLIGQAEGSRPAVYGGDGVDKGRSLVLVLGIAGQPVGRAEEIREGLILGLVVGAVAVLGEHAARAAVN